MRHNVDGTKAENYVAKHLVAHGYKILNRNWKTKWCEIDVVAEKGDCIYFVEVKYRSNTLQGSGFDYITPPKLKQMEFAANLWVANNQWDGEYVLSAAEVSGMNFKVEFIDQI